MASIACAGIEVDELAGIGHHFDDPEDVERVATVMNSWRGPPAQP